MNFICVGKSLNSLRSKFCLIYFGWNLVFARQFKTFFPISVSNMSNIFKSFFSFPHLFVFSSAHSRSSHVVKNVIFSNPTSRLAVVSMTPSPRCRHAHVKIKSFLIVSKPKLHTVNVRKRMRKYKFVWIIVAPRCLESCVEITKSAR